MEEIKKIGNYTLKVGIDEEPLHPRKDYDTLGTILSGHKRYNLGEFSINPEKYNSAPKNMYEYFLYHINDNFNLNKENKNGLLSANAIKLIENWIDKNIIYEKLYLYDHGNIVLSTKPFSNTFDSSTLGYIYTDYKTIKDKYFYKDATDGKMRYVDEDTIKRAKEELNHEVIKYNNYLNENIFCFQIDCGDEDVHFESGFANFEEAKEAGILTLLNSAKGLKCYREKKNNDEIYWISEERFKMDNNDKIPELILLENSENKQFIIDSDKDLAFFVAQCFETNDSMLFNLEDSFFKYEVKKTTDGIEINKYFGENRNIINSITNQNFIEKKIYEKDNEIFHNYSFLTERFDASMEYKQNHNLYGELEF